MFSKKNLKREDFIFQNGWFQNKIKKPKEMHMQQFQISDCQECNIFIFDSSACVYIDQCKYCNIFIGPCQSSVFIRDCQGLIVISISQQFRVRDTFKSTFSIFCQSQPIIQSSSELTFSCISSQFGYKQLTNQSKEAKLNLWNNNWFDVYDFTPSKFSTENYKRIDFKQWKDRSLILNLFQKTLKQNQVCQQRHIIPQCIGKYKENHSLWESSQILILIFFSIPQAVKFDNVQVVQFRYQIVPSQIQHLLQDCQFSLNKKVLFAKILKKEQERFKTYKNYKKIIKIQEIQLLQTIIFTPFKDEH